MIRATGGPGYPAPITDAEREAVESLFAGPGNVRRAARDVDWSATSLGAVSRWSPAMKSLVRTVLAMEFPASLMLGPDLICVENEPAVELMKQPVRIGKPGSVAYSDRWDRLRPVLQGVIDSGIPIGMRDAMFPVLRAGLLQETYWHFCRNPAYDESGRVIGVLQLGTEVTESVLALRRIELLRHLGMNAAGTHAMQAVCERVADTLSSATDDVPFALLYLVGGGRRRANLCAAAGVEAGAPAAPRSIDLDDEEVAWDVHGVMSNGAGVVVDDVAMRFPQMRSGPWPEQPTTAMILPLRPNADEPPFGAVVLGVSARLPFDAAYRAWFEHVASQISSHIAAQEERRLDLVALLNTIQEDERSRLARDMHDQIGQELTALSLLLKIAGDNAVKPDIIDSLSRAQAAVRRIAGEAHAMAMRLRPMALDDLGLAPAVAQLVADWSSRTGVPIDLEDQTQARPRLPGPIETAIYRTVQEALTNVARHAAASRASVSLTRHDGLAIVMIEDDGRGFDTARATEGRIGLVGMRERIALIGGTLELDSDAGHGTTIIARIPVPLGKDTTRA